MKSIHALLVDDDRQALSTMGTILEMDNYVVSTAESGRMALEILENAEANPPHVDFVVMDLEMANLSGIELLLEMRQRGHALPVMVVTGYASKATVVELLRQGVSDFLDKPVNLSEFRARINRLAGSVLQYRWKRAGLDAASDAPPVPATTVVDLSSLGMPYAARRLIESGPDSHLALACRRPGSFDVLLADVRAAGPESFYMSVLIKSFFEDHRRGDIDGMEFMRKLDQVIREGGLGNSGVGGLLLRLRPAERRLEVYPAGYAAHLFLGIGDAARMTGLQGAPLGLTGGAKETLVEIPFRRRDRLVLYSEGGPAPAEVKASILAEMAGPVEVTVDWIWKDILAGGRDRRNHDVFLLGIELP